MKMLVYIEKYPRANAKMHLYMENDTVYEYLRVYIILCVNMYSYL